jgi:hypothetical protein
MTGKRWSILMGSLVALSSLGCYEVHVDQCERNEAVCDGRDAKNCRDLYGDGRLFWDKELCWRGCLVTKNEQNRAEAICVEEDAQDPRCQQEGDGSYCSDEGPFTCRLGYITSQELCPYSATCDGETLTCSEATEDAPYCDGVPEDSLEYRCIEGNILARCQGSKSISENRCLKGFTCPIGDYRCRQN